MKLPFKWEVIDAQTLRAKVPGGWLVRYHSHTGPVAMTVVADPKHDWEVEVLPEAVEVARERLTKLEHDLQDPYVDDAIKSEMQDEIANLRRFIEQHQ
jgi:hypothetical protein